MYVCICRGITDSQLRAAIDDGARDMREVSRCLGVATQCGKCGRHARTLLKAAHGAVLESAKPTSEQGTPAGA